MQFHGKTNSYKYNLHRRQSSFASYTSTSPRVYRLVIYWWIIKWKNLYFYLPDYLWLFLFRLLSTSWTEGNKLFRCIKTDLTTTITLYRYCSIPFLFSRTICIWFIHIYSVHSQMHLISVQFKHKCCHFLRSAIHH